MLLKTLFTCVVIAAQIVLSLEVESHVVLVPCCIGAQLAGVGTLMAQATRGSILVHNIWNVPCEIILARLRQRIALNRNLHRTGSEHVSGKVLSCLEMLVTVRTIVTA